MHPAIEVYAVVLAHLLTAWLVSYLIHSTASLGLALAACKRVRSAEVRVLIWRAAIMGPVFTACLQVWLHARTEPTGASLVVARGVSGSPWIALGIVALASLVFLRGVLVAARAEIQTRRILGSCAFEGNADMLADVSAFARAAGCAVPALVTAGGIASPLARLRTICVPSRMYAMPVPHRRALLAHEVAHIAARDALWLGAAALLRHAAAFQPLTAVALLRLQLDTEVAADAAAVRMTQRPAALAEALLHLARVQCAPAHAACATGADSALVLRVSHILDDATVKSPVRMTYWRVVVGVALIAVSFVPGVAADPAGVANTIDWLAPSRREPGARMLQFREFERAASRMLDGN